MEMQELVTGFLGSSQGQDAHATLTAQGIDPSLATTLLGHAAEAAANHVNEQHPPPAEGLLGSIFGHHAGRNFLAGIAAGIARGDGVVGSLEDGAMGVVTGRITEALVEKAGLDGGTASTVAAAATPFIVGFLKEKLGAKT